MVSVNDTVPGLKFIANVDSTESAKNKPKSKAGGTKAGGTESRKTTRVQKDTAISGFSPAAKSFGSELTYV